MENVLERPDQLVRAYEACIREVLANHPDAGPRVKLRFARQFLGMTQREFADRFGISPVTVRNWESASRPEPSGPAEAFINILAQDPAGVLALADRSRGSQKVSPVRDVVAAMEAD
jgi:DNA-binding transcriptional regulator YiaG